MPNLHSAPDIYQWNLTNTVDKIVKDGKHLSNKLLTKRIGELLWQLIRHEWNNETLLQKEITN